MPRVKDDALPTVVFLLWADLGQVSGVTSWALRLRGPLRAAGFSVRMEETMAAAEEA